MSSFDDSDDWENTASFQKKEVELQFTFQIKEVTRWLLRSAFWEQWQRDEMKIVIKIIGRFSQITDPMP